MKHAICLFTLMPLIFLAACATSQKETIAKQPQVVEFAESEVPYIQVTKKDGKVSAEIVELNTAKVSAK